MNPKVFVGIAIVALGAIIGGILLVGPSMDIVPQQDNIPSSESISQIMPLEVTLDDISVKRISERTATIEIAFEITNPNPRSMIVQVMDYQLFETGYSDFEQIAGGSIGSRPQGMVEFGSNYYTLLGNNSILLKDDISLRNSGNTPEFWSALEDDTASWRVTGDVFYNLSSMTSGQENELHFEFTK